MLCKDAVVGRRFSALHASNVAVHNKKRKNRHDKTNARLAYYRRTHVREELPYALYVRLGRKADGMR